MSAASGIDQAAGEAVERAHDKVLALVIE